MCNKISNAIICPIEGPDGKCLVKKPYCDSNPFAEPDRMELPDIPFNKAEYIETASGNRVSRASVLCGSQNIILNGKNIVQSEAIIRGDLANVRVGRHCVISSKAVSAHKMNTLDLISYKCLGDQTPFQEVQQRCCFLPFAGTNISQTLHRIFFFKSDWGPCFHWRGECYQRSSGQFLCLHW